MDKKALIGSVNITISDNANIGHIIGTDYDDIFIGSQEGNIKFVLNEGNDEVVLYGNHNIVYINA